jgi:hypothetical protein
MNISEILTVGPGDEDFLAVVNEEESIESILDREAIMDWIALRMDGYDEELDEVQTVFPIFDFVDAIILPPEEIIRDFLDKDMLMAYLEKKNDEYCSERNMCPVCHSQLHRESGGRVEFWGAPCNLPDEIVCPNGCV